MMRQSLNSSFSRRVRAWAENGSRVVLLLFVVFSVVSPVLFVVLLPVALF